MSVMFVALLITRTSAIAFLLWWPWYLWIHGICDDCDCSRHGFTYIRGWMLAPSDFFSWNNNTMSYILVMDMLHYCCLMHNDTYSVHDRSLKPWWSRLPCLQSFCYDSSPPLSGFNWRLTSPFGGLGPPTPKMASPLLGSPHTPFPGSVTVMSAIVFILWCSWCLTMSVMSMKGLHDSYFHDVMMFLTLMHSWLWCLWWPWYYEVTDVCKVHDGFDILTLWYS
jgi:hypothetical protein